MESFKEIGYFWQPEYPEKQIAGELVYDPDTGGTIEIFGDFDDLEKTGQTGDRITILGLSQSGKNYSLFKCLKISSSINIPGIPSATYKVHVILKGGLFLDLDAVRFDSFCIYFTNLDDWLGHEILFYTIENNVESSIYRYSVEYKPETIPEYYIPGIGSLNFLYEHKVKVEPVPVIHKFSAETEFFVKFIPENPVGVHEMNTRYSADFCNFLTLAIQKPSYPYKFVGYIKPDPDSEENSDTIQIDIYQRIRSFNQENKRIHPSELLFSYRKISSNFPKYYGNWISFCHRVKPCIDLYFSIHYRKPLHLEDSFQKVIQALEVYHRRSTEFSGEFCTEEEFKTIYKNLLNQIPVDISQDFKASMENKLSYFDQYSLQRRIKELLRDCVDKHGSVIIEIFGKPPEWAKKVADRRDFFIHREEDQETEDLQLYIWMLQGSLLLNLMFYREIGFDEESIHKMIIHSRYFEKIQLNQGLKNSHET